VQIDGEYYLQEFQPGQGVASIGLDEAAPGEAKTPTTAANGEPVF